MLPLRDTRSKDGSYPYQTVGLILLTFVVFLFQLNAANPTSFIFTYGLVPAAVNWSDPYTLYPFLTSIFLHGSWLHILGNMLFLWVFGDNIERRFKGWYIPFYLAGGVVASLAQYYFTSGSDIPMVGASGAVAAILGAYYILFPRSKVQTLVPIFIIPFIFNLPARFLLIVWFILQLFNGVASVGGIDLGAIPIAYLAHVGGFVFGLWVAAYAGKPEQ